MTGRQLALHRISAGFESLPAAEQARLARGFLGLAPLLSRSTSDPTIEPAWAAIEGGLIDFFSSSLTGLLSPNARARWVDGVFADAEKFAAPICLAVRGVATP